ncbi:hypothetical protein AMTR_s00038p00187290 [Amborella trichopoda]|uniref:Uncharacterized protein n=1 Tax=Amborella trichopoda TaxID=13333 RepID=U5CXF9_AMBTC|nr:hypothetical protein AMTR_s00038p00187290 [Amborella trichopoda]
MEAKISSVISDSEMDFSIMIRVVFQEIIKKKKREKKRSVDFDNSETLDKMVGNKRPLFEVSSLTTLRSKGDKAKGI